jgi:hypothetical protein
MRNGTGTFKYANGDVFKGEYKDGVKNGEGKLKLANGKV